MRMLKVAYYKPKQPMKAVEIEDTLLELQGLVGGNIEVVRFASNLVIVCNEEGRLKGLEQNRLNLVGPFFVVGESGEGFGSLTDEEVDVLGRMLK